MKKYEVIFIVRPTLEEATTKEVVKNFEAVLTNNKAIVEKTEFLGRKELAYEIKNYKAGFYYLITFEANDNVAIKEFDRLALISEDIIRHLVVKLDK